MADFNVVAIELTLFSNLPIAIFIDKIAAIIAKYDPAKGEYAVVETITERYVVKETFAQIKKMMSPPVLQSNSA